MMLSLQTCTRCKAKCVWASTTFLCDASAAELRILSKGAFTTGNPSVSRACVVHNFVLDALRKKHLSRNPTAPSLPTRTQALILESGVDWADDPELAEEVLSLSRPLQNQK